MKRPEGRIPFNRPAVTGKEQQYIDDVFRAGKFGGGGRFSLRCRSWLEDKFGSAAVLTTPSCTHALEMAAMLCDLEPGDEVILPSFAFSSTATAFARCGAQLVFVDIDPETMNIDPKAVEASISDRSKVLVTLDYAGVPCSMDALEDLARRRGLMIVEDAAQAIFSEYRGRPCGTLGTFGCFSFHETKNIQCGEGGALLINDPQYVERAEILWEKGTDRTRFFRGEVDRYTWRDLGSSFVLGELCSAFLLAQLEHGDRITADRLAIWNAYQEGLAPLADLGLIGIPQIPPDLRHNGHIFWIKVRDATAQAALLAHLENLSIHSVFHYVPLHSSPAGRRFGRFSGVDRWTTRESERLIRLPVFKGFTETERVVKAIGLFFSNES